MSTTQWIVVSVAFFALISLALALIVMGGSRRRIPLFLQLFGFTVLSATLVWYALSWPRPIAPASSVTVGDLVAVNPYSVETRSGGADAPWRPDGQWLIGGRNQQPVVALDVTSPDDGATLAGTVTYKGEDTLGLRAKAIGTNTYLVETQQGAASEPWGKGGIWVLGARGAQQPVVALKVASADDGESLTGSMAYQGEGSIDFRTRLPEPVQAPPPPALVADLVAVNPYSVEIRAGGTDAPWRPDGQWLIGGRNQQPVVALDVTSPDDGATLAGTVTYKGEDALGLRAKAIGTNTYLVETHQGAASAPWRKGGIWVLGARGAQRPVVALKVASADGGESLTGNMAYRGEGPISFRTRPPEPVQAPPPPALVADLVAVNPYSVETRSGGADAPWRPDGQWLIGGRNQQPVVALDVTSPDDGATLAGTVTYKGEDALGLRAKAIGTNTYLVETHQGAASAPWRKGGIWVLGARGTQQPVVALKVASADGGESLTGNMAYRGEGPISFRTRPPVIAQAPARVVIAEAGKFYRESDRPDVLFQYSAQDYCKPQNADQMQAYGGADNVIVAAKVQMAGQFAGACPWRDGFYRINVDGAERDYLLYGVGEVKDIGKSICRLLTPEQRDAYAKSGAFSDFGTITQASDLTRMRGDLTLDEVDDCPWVGLERVSFAINDDRIKPEARPLIEAIAKSFAIKISEYKVKNPDKTYMILVEGHTDYSGDNEHNCSLALRRAKKVAALLERSTSLGSDVKILPIGFGFHRLLTSNPKGEKVAANRRFEVRLIDAERLPSERREAEACDAQTAEGSALRPGQ